MRADLILKIPAQNKTMQSTLSEAEKKCRYPNSMPEWTVEDATAALVKTPV